MLRPPRSGLHPRGHGRRECAPSAQPEFTEEWWITSDEWEAFISDQTVTAESPRNLLVRYGDEARWYQERVTDPRVVNWVRLEFIYF